MRILYCNKYNFPFSGTEAYMFEAMKLMRSKGHEAALFSMADSRGQPGAYDEHFMPHIDFKDQNGWFHKAKLAVHAVYSIEARRRIRTMIGAFRPHVAHVRNIYHHLSPSILWELKAQNVPVIYHLNDFKVLCPSYNLVLRGEACEACKGGHFWHALTEKCYPGSAERLALVAEAYFHKMISTYRKCVDCFLAPSRFVREKFIEHGWDPAKFQVLPHFQTVKNTEITCSEDGPPLYFGRLSREKGVDDLLRAMQRLPHLRLKVAGDGPERGALQTLSLNLGLKNVEFVGQLRGEDLERAIINSPFTVLPSHAYETLGKTILESHAFGRAVVASDMGSRRELIEDRKTGLLYRTGDVNGLAAALEFLSSQPELAKKMGLAGKEKVERSYTPESHYQVLVELYERMSEEKKLAIAQRKGRGWVGVMLSSSKPSVQDVIPTPAQTRPLRIAFIGGRGVCSKYSGIETYYEEVGTRLAQLGHEVTAYCRTYFTLPMKEHNGMKVIRIPTIRSKHSETLLHTLLSTLHALTEPCDIVHYHALGPALFSFIPRLIGKKTVVTVQGLDWQRKKWGCIASAVLRVGERAAVRLPSGTMVVSRTLQRHYREHHGVETTYVPNGGLLREHRSPRKILEWGLEPQQYILFLGRISPEKGCHLLVEAYEKLSTDIKLVLAGAASYCDEYSWLLRSHGNDRIRILDWVSGETLDELLTNAMVFVLPSELEGLSLALLDAMGAGLCVVASDIPENREAVQDAGFTFRQGDASDLADRLSFLIANPAVRRAAGEAAKGRIRDNYQWDRISSEVEQVYFNILGLRPSDAGMKKPSGRATIEMGSASGRKAG
jgi:glycosyltransferase involved in cell wall biosynthesis